MRDQDKIKADDQPTTEGDPGKADVATQTEDAADSKVSRRRALIAGLAAAPVILTLMNRSAFGAECTSQTLINSYNQQGRTLTTSFLRRHPNVTIQNGQLECNTPT